MNIRTAVAAAVAVSAGLLVTAPTAQAQAAPIGRWAGPAPEVEVFSTARTGWGVGRAITQWNRSGAVKLVLVSDPCADCIIVDEQVLANVEGHESEDVAGLARFTMSQASVGVITGCHISLDPEHLTSLRARSITAAHEIGHCLGLPHNHGAWSALNSGAENIVYRPSRGDLSRLAAVYAPAL